MKFLARLFGAARKGAPEGVPPSRLQQAIALHQEGRLQEARDLYEAALRDNPREAGALHLLGVMAVQGEDFARGVELIGQALALEPANVSVLYNYGNALKGSGRLEEAIRSYDRAIELSPGHCEALSNRGLSLHELGRFAEAIESYDRAVAIAPRYALALFNRGNALFELGELRDALASYDRTLEAQPGFAKAWHNRGVTLKRLRRPQEALASLERGQALAPDLPFLAGAVIDAKLEMCDWRTFEHDMAWLELAIGDGKPAVEPFIVLATHDAPPLQRRAAEIYVATKHPPNEAFGPPAGARRPGKIRLGYFSADYGEHPVSHLVADVFAAHDRERFEVIGVSLAPPNEHELRRRIVASFDRFVEAGATPDREVAALSREMGIDIAIDLGGHTQHARTGVFALRAAPVQASYLGYLGTLGAGYSDYLLADAVLVPRESRAHYTESIVYLRTYQANAATRSVEDALDREALGIPRPAFAFACFNNSYKISPAVFAAWMRILARVEGSVLVLLARNEWVPANLRVEAARQGVDPERLVFVPPLARTAYLSRLRAVDLFLDTHPYNAGTIGSDALWAGLPVLTRAGDAFASRMGASLLTAVGLPELIARTWEEYERSAVELAQNPAALQALRAELERRRSTSILFDGAAFTRDLERAYLAMFERSVAGLPPEDIA